MNQMLEFSDADEPDDQDVDEEEHESEEELDNANDEDYEEEEPEPEPEEESEPEPEPSAKRQARVSNPLAAISNTLNMLTNTISKQPSAKSFTPVSKATSSKATTPQSAGSDGSKKRKHVKTGQKKGGARKSNKRKTCEFFIATIRSQQLHGEDSKVIKNKCLQELKKYSNSELGDLLNETTKLIDTVDVSNTDAIIIISDAIGNEKEYFEQASAMSAQELSDQIESIEEKLHEAENLLEILETRKKGLQYLFNKSNSAKSAGKLFSGALISALSRNITSMD